MIIVMGSFSKGLVFKMFSARTNTKSRCFKFIQFEERFRKAPLPRRINVDGWPNRKNKAASFSNTNPKWPVIVAFFSCPFPAF